MKYTFTPHDNILVLNVDNLLMAYENTRLLRDTESKIEEGHHHYIIDLNTIQYMNSVGLSFMIAVLTKSRNVGGETIITGVSPKIDELLAVTKLKSIFTTCDTVENAIKLLKTQSSAQPSRS